MCADKQALSRLRNYRYGEEGGKGGLGAHLYSGWDDLKRAFLLLLLLVPGRLWGGNLTVGLTTLTADCETSGVLPGNTITVTNGTRGQLRVQNCKGTSLNPITIINASGGQVIFDSSISGEAGMKIFGCQYVHVTGTGKVGVTYGFKAINATLDGINTTDNVGNDGNLDGTDHIEIDHFEITACQGGIQSARNVIAEGLSLAWVGTGFNFHDLYIHDLTAPGETFYIGASTSVGSYPIHNVEIHHNTVVNAIYDGIQVRQGRTSVLVHDNYINTTGTNPCKNGTFDNTAGLNIAHDNQTGEWYNNVIINPRKGVYLSDVSNIKIYNNVIVDAGRQVTGSGSCPGGGSTTDPEGAFQIHNSSNIQIYNNTVVNRTVTPDYAVEIQSGNSSSLLKDNIMAGMSTFVSGSTGFTQTNNYTSTTLGPVAFYDTSTDDYHLTVSSPPKDTGSASGYPLYDLDGISRPRGSASDRGAYEFNISPTVSNNAASGNVTGPNVSLALPSDATSGCSLWASVRLDSTGFGPYYFDDDNGGTWTTLFSEDNGVGWWIGVAWNHPAGATTISGHTTTGAPHMRMNIFEVCGVGTDSTAIDIATTVTGAASATPSTGATATRAQTGEVLLGFMRETGPNQAISAGTGFTLLNNNGNSIGTDYQLVTATGTDAITFSLAASASWRIKGYTIKTLASDSVGAVTQLRQVRRRTN